MLRNRLSHIHAFNIRNVHLFFFFWLFVLGSLLLASISHPGLNGRCLWGQ